MNTLITDQPTVLTNLVEVREFFEYRELADNVPLFEWSSFYREALEQHKVAIRRVINLEFTAVEESPYIILRLIQAADTIDKLNDLQEQINEILDGVLIKANIFNFNDSSLYSWAKYYWARTILEMEEDQFNISYEFANGYDEVVDEIIRTYTPA